MKSLPRIPLAALLAAFFLAEAQAAEFDPKQIRIITPTSATSDCIGDPRTPLCAVETVAACFARVDYDLCRKAGVENPAILGGVVSIAYKVRSIRILRPSDIPKELKDTYWYRPGFARIVVELCGYAVAGEVKAKCDGEETMSYSVKPTPEGWRVVSWASSLQPD